MTTEASGRPGAAVVWQPRGRARAQVAALVVEALKLLQDMRANSRSQVENLTRDLQRANEAIFRLIL